MFKLALSLFFAVFFSIMGTIQLQEGYNRVDKYLNANGPLAWARLWYFWALISGGGFLVAVFNT